MTLLLLLSIARNIRHAFNFLCDSPLFLVRFKSIFIPISFVYLSKMNNVSCNTTSGETALHCSQPIPSPSSPHLTLSRSVLDTLCVLTVQIYKSIIGKICSLSSNGTKTKLAIVSDLSFYSHLVAFAFSLSLVPVKSFTRPFRLPHKSPFIYTTHTNLWLYLSLGRFVTFSLGSSFWRNSLSSTKKSIEAVYTAQFRVFRLVVKITSDSNQMDRLKATRFFIIWKPHNWNTFNAFFQSRKLLG